MRIVRSVHIVLFVFYISFLSCNRFSGNLGEDTPAFDTLVAKAERLYDTGDKSAALHMVLEAHTRGPVTKMDDLDYFCFCDNIYRKDLKDYTHCIAAADSMIRICELDRNNKKIQYKYIIAYNNKADALMSLGDYMGAYDCYYQAKKLAEAFQESCALSKYSYSLSMVLFKQQKFRESATYFREAFDEVGKCTEDFGVFYKKQELLDNLGLCYYHLGKYDSAEGYYQHALSYIDSNSGKFPAKNRIAFITAKAVIYGNLADIYSAQGNKDTAIAMLNRSIKVNLQKEYSNSDAELDQVKLAKMYFELGREAELEQTLANIKAELDTLPDLGVELQWNKLMWQLNDKRNQPAAAYPYISSYVRINDSLTKQNNLLVESDIEGRIRNHERQYQLSMLHVAAHSQKIYLVVVSIAACLAVIIIFIILFNARRTKQNLTKLTSLNNTVNEQKVKLEAALAGLEQQDRDKTRILRAVAHDVMNPISAIISLTDILTAEDRIQEGQREVLNLIKESCQNSIALSKSILEASQLTDPDNLKKEWVNVSDLVGSSVELLNYKAAAKKQKINITVPEEPVKAFVSKEKIWRAVNNLLGNAIKFSHEGGSIEVSLSQLDPFGNPVGKSTGKARFDASDKVLITIQDHGIGIREKDKPLIFDMFTEAKNQGTAGEVSHGLGLSISLQIVKVHGGTIRFESKEGVGTTFYIEFPLNDGEV